MNFIRIRHAPLQWSVGLFVAAAVAYGMWKLAGEEFHWWMLLICVFVSFLTDLLLVGKTSQDEVYIAKR